MCSLCASVAVLQCRTQPILSRGLVAAWLPEKEDPDVVMLEIDIEMGEHWAAKESKVFQLYEMAKANVKSDKTPNIGENEKFGG